LLHLHLNKRHVEGILFVVASSLMLHTLFSRFGFNPTDDGLFLACTARILQGQIPHRDFIFIFPTGSCYLYVPFLLLSGNYVIWITRWFAWFEFAVVAWLWTDIASVKLGAFQNVLEKYAVASMALMLSVHTFVIGVFYTVDALFFATMGIWLICAQSRLRMRLLGLLLLGASPLFKQSFVALLPLCFLLLSGWKEWRKWLLTLLPAVVYFVFLFLEGGLQQGIAQLTTYNGIFFTNAISTSAVGKYVSGELALVFWTALSITLILLVQRYRFVRQLIYLPVMFVIQSLSTGQMAYLVDSAVLVGIAFGLSVFCASTKEAGSGRYAGLASAVAWVVTWSNGYGYPALAAGPLVAMIFGRINKTRFSSVRRVFLVGLVLFTAFSFSYARMNIIYRDLPATQLTCDLGPLLRGGNLILTNPNMCSFLSDLHAAEVIAAQTGKPYAVLYDLPAVWIISSQRNPLPDDWVFLDQVYGSSAATSGRTVDALRNQHGQIVVIVQKVLTDQIAYRFLPYAPPSDALDFVHQNYTQFAETQFFTLYQ